MKPTTALNLIRLFGILGIVLGLVLLIIDYGISAFAFKVLIIVFAVLFIALGFFIYKRATSRLELFKESEGEEGTEWKTISAIVLGLAILSAMIPVYAASQPPEVYRACIETYTRLMIVEYLSILFVFIMGFLSAAPILLARTHLGPIVNEIAGMAGGMLLVAIFFALMFWGIHVIFTVDTQNQRCEVNFDRLKTEGPPLLRLVYRLFNPSAFMP